MKLSFIASLTSDEYLLGMLWFQLFSLVQSLLWFRFSGSDASLAIKLAKSVLSGAFAITSTIVGICYLESYAVTFWTILNLWIPIVLHLLGYTMYLFHSYLSEPIESPS